jgi:hypothetical protein
MVSILTVPGTPEAGQFGIWTERDGVTRYSEIEISPVNSEWGRSDPQGRFGG